MFNITNAESIGFPIVYLLFENGFSPVALSWAYLIVYVLAGLLIKYLAYSENSGL